MRLILIGCEYVGKTTLANKITDWLKETTGGGRTFHDHFTIPPSELSADEQIEFLRMSPELQAMFQRYAQTYHLNAPFYSDSDHLLVGFHIEEAIYAPLYYSYGVSCNTHPSTWSVEKRILEQAPDTVLILLRASPKAISTRMQEHPHQYALVQEEDIEFILQRFETEYERSLLFRKFTLDTTSATIEETLTDFVARIDSHLTETDRLRMMTHHALKQDAEFHKAHTGG